ncbi:PREDICTED: interleukin-6 receptor subunit alpha [Elephantulus edwardii]|uniref:interleukin-6 receptor subunit alpha n=1 Tax=Elephantulus edwardii TaxID=28737 RepID=UPI0003F0E4D5|nr:PREDICTED: interleukin-6 receptor subunit alpha [Elephantulus edwardii]
MPAHPLPCPVPASRSQLVCLPACFSPGVWGVSRGRNMLAVRCALLAALLAAPGTAVSPGTCPAPDVRSDVLTSLPGANVTLTCPGVKPGSNGTVRWLLKNLARGRWASVGSSLLLSSVQPSHSGNYSCYQDGQSAGTVCLLVEDPENLEVDVAGSSFIPVLTTEAASDENTPPLFPANTTSLPVQNASSVQLSTFLVAGGSLALGTLLCIGIVLRFKNTSKRRALKKAKTSMHPPYTMGQLVAERPKAAPVLDQLNSPPASPSSLGSDNASSGHSQPGAQDPQSSYDINNRDYFFPR